MSTQSPQEVAEHNRRERAKARFPWNVVKSFAVKSCADGTLRIEPVYNPAKFRPYTPENGGGPGLMTRLDLAEWCERRLAKRCKP